MSKPRRHYELTDDEWNRTKDFFPTNSGSKLGHPYNDIRTVVNGIIWIARSAAPWCGYLCGKRCHALNSAGSFYCHGR